MACSKCCRCDLPFVWSQLRNLSLSKVFEDYDVMAASQSLTDEITNNINIYHIPVYIPLCRFCPRYNHANANTQGTTVVRISLPFKSWSKGYCHIEILKFSWNSLITKKLKKVALLQYHMYELIFPKQLEICSKSTVQNNCISECSTNG